MEENFEDRKASRRGFFREALASVLGPMAELISDRLDLIEPFEPIEPDEYVPAPLRPPGAVAGDAFDELCDRCGRCAEACPVGAIVVHPAPHLDPARQGCLMCKDLPCIAACPTGALEPTERGAVSMGLAVWDPTACLLPPGEECSLCQQACPVAGTIRIEAGCVEVAGDTCAGCGCCQTVCPADPKAITVEPF